METRARTFKQRHGQIEAVQFDPLEISESVSLREAQARGITVVHVMKFHGEIIHFRVQYDEQLRPHLAVDTRNGVDLCEPGDYVACSSAGEMFVLSEKTFQMMFELQGEPVRS